MVYYRIEYGRRVVMPLKSKAQKKSGSNDEEDLIRRLFNNNVLSVKRYKQFFHEDVCLHGPASDEEHHGLDRIVELDSIYGRAFTQIRVKIEQLFSNNDKVVIRWTISGKHTGRFKGIEASQKAFSGSGQSIYRIRNGKIAEIWQSWDRLGLLEQIGEVSIKTSLIQPEMQRDLLISLGMEKYLERTSLLTYREQQCLKGLLKNETAKETAKTLGLSFRTVESYLENIKNKLECQDKRELLKAAQLLEKAGVL